MRNTARAKTYISTHICCSLRLSWENRSDFELAGEQLFKNTSQQQLRSLLVQHRDGLCIRAGIKPPHHSPALLSLSFHIPQWVPLNKHFLPGRHLLLSYSLRNGIIIIIKKKVAALRNRLDEKEKLTARQPPSELLYTWEYLPRLAEGTALPRSTCWRPRG